MRTFSLSAPAEHHAIARAAGYWCHVGLNTPRRPRRYFLWAAAFVVLAVAGIVVGTVADAHHLAGVGRLAADLVGVALALVLATLARAYLNEVRIPSLARQLTAMLQAMDAGQPVSGRFATWSHDLVPGAPLRTRWKYGRVMITPESVVWVRRMTGRARDLTGAQCTGERKPDPSYTEMTLSLPSYCKGENVRVLTLHADGADVELAAPAQLLEIIRYSLAQTTPGALQPRRAAHRA